jgi:hypothetical protein
VQPYGEGWAPSDPIAFGQHSHNFAMRVLADLPDQRFAIGFGHPILGFNFYFPIELVLEIFFEILYRHLMRFWNIKIGKTE